MTPGVRELSAAETALAYPAICHLRQGRPQIESEASFVAWVNDRQRPEGYRLFGSFAPGVAHAVGVAGFRLMHGLWPGRHLYLDDLITHPDFRGAGHADALFRALVDEAWRLGCEYLQLDSGPTRHAAHRFYLKHGMDIGALHFGLRLEDQ